MQVSVIIPMFNEEANVRNAIFQAMKAVRTCDDWEILVVDDGSTDRTFELAREVAAAHPRIRLLSHPSNLGRGRALRTGFAQAQKDIIVTLDADLSYDVTHIPRLTNELADGSGVDIVVGSPYMRGGAAEGVPLIRLLLSKVGNKLLGFALPGRLHTVTGILRAYRRKVFESLELESDGKEIHLEILSKALALGHQVKEVPATLRGRKKGKSKLKLRATVLSHLMFSFYEKPAMLFGVMGLFMVLVGFILGGFLFSVWLKGQLNPERPLMAVTVTLIVAGIQVFIFGFVSTQIVGLRRELYKIQRENLRNRNSNNGSSTEFVERNDDDSLSLIAAGRGELE